MTPLSRAGATCLVTGPIVGLASVLIERTLSGQASDLAIAHTADPGAAHLGLGANAVATVLTAAGLIWFAWTTHTPLAAAGRHRRRTRCDLPLGVGAPGHTRRAPRIGGYGWAIMRFR